jgi:protein-S-isoprenylcysteine O-methyltransferase Ste14
VLAGPYRHVRNPMAVAGIAQGVAVALWLGSWAVLLYAVSGALLWHMAIRSAEERDLAERFG